MYPFGGPRLKLGSVMTDTIRYLINKKQHTKESTCYKEEYVEYLSHRREYDLRMPASAQEEQGASPPGSQLHLLFVLRHSSQAAFENKSTQRIKYNRGRRPPRVLLFRCCSCKLLDEIGVSDKSFWCMLAGAESSIWAEEGRSQSRGTR